jgi:hypothetical protein
VLHFNKDLGTGMCMFDILVGESDITIICNFQQQSMHIAFHLGSNKL